MDGLNRYFGFGFTDLYSEGDLWMGFRNGRFQMIFGNGFRDSMDMRDNWIRGYMDGMGIGYFKGVRIYFQVGYWVDG